MQKLPSKQKPFYPVQYVHMELKAANGLVNRESKDQRFSVQLRNKYRWAVVQVLPYIYESIPMMDPLVVR